MAVKSQSTSSTEATPGVPMLRLDSQPMPDYAEEHSNGSHEENGQPLFNEIGCSVGKHHTPPCEGVSDSSHEPRGDKRSLNDYLRSECVEHHEIEAEGHRFWGYKRLERIMTHAQIRAALLDECGFGGVEAGIYCDQILPQQSSTYRSYLRVFAILILAEMGHDIGKFLHPPLSDSQFSMDTDVKGLLAKQKVGVKWKARDWDSFDMYKRRVLIPYFKMGSEKSVRSYDLHPSTLLPWLAQHSAQRGNGLLRIGGYASVKTVKIDPDSHDFTSLLRRLDLYSDFVAVKSLDPSKSADREAFDRERKMLEQYGAQAQTEDSPAHKHMITLLATYTLGGTYHFIFPAARCNLDEYFKTRDGPLAPRYRPINHEMRECLIWVSEQILGLVGAVHYMHSATQVYLDANDKYGRHGDLKLENILWFLSPSNERGRFVIGDLGIADIHGEHSRSKVPNDNLPTTATYRAPECDILGGTISRAYDIWTLGCVFLEIICWMLGGDALRQEFCNERLSTSPLAVRTSNYFDVQKLNDDLYRIKVKHQVIRFIVRLHKDEGCTPYIHKLLDAVSEGMLRVRSKDRYDSKTLLKKLTAMHKDCKDDESYTRPSTEPWQGFQHLKHDEPLDTKLSSRISRALNNPLLAGLPIWSATQAPAVVNRL